jgi:lipopolysaccharide transport system ATP-binding protein
VRRRGQRLFEFLFDWFIRGQRKMRFLVLDDVSLKIYPGEIVGLVGSNGSGKSTLLRILTGISRATKGEVKIHGIYRELFALNAGFNMNLSGRKNIYLYAAMKYIPTEVIEEKIDAIIEYSGLADFIDEPVKSYSSGMRSRLGFSIVINTLPSIIFIDEALSPGDEAFREKCNNTLLQLKEQGNTIVLVSHSLATLRTLCTRVIWLEGGKIKMDGPALSVIREYKIFQDERNNKVRKA